MVSVFGQRGIDDVFGKFAQGSFLVMADMPAAGRGMDHHHVPLAEQAAENRLVGIGASCYIFFCSINLGNLSKQGLYQIPSTN